MLSRFSFAPLKRLGRPAVIACSGSFEPTTGVSVALTASPSSNAEPTFTLRPAVLKHASVRSPWRSGVWPSGLGGNSFDKDVGDTRQRASAGAHC